MNKRTMFMIGVVSAALLTSAGAVNATPTKNTIYETAQRLTAPLT